MRVMRVCVLVCIWGRRWWTGNGGEGGSHSEDGFHFVTRELNAMSVSSTTCETVVFWVVFCPGF